MHPTLTALVSGTLFGAGLAIARMTDPAKILGFLDVAGAWDPSLAFVMGVALAVTAIAHRIRRDLTRPITSIDPRLIGGSVLFGIGWGLAGFCPGPAIAALITGSPRVALFVVSMLGGMALYHAVFDREAWAAGRAVEDV